jgi:general secretion pathway protein D
MEKYKWYSLILLILMMSVMLVGCVSLREDMRLSNKGLGEIKDGHYQEAEKYLQRALSINPDNPYAILNMGVVYYETGRKEQAREMFNKVLSIAEQEKAEQSNQDWAVGRDVTEIAKKNLENME